MVSLWPAGCRPFLRQRRTRSVLCGHICPWGQIGLLWPHFMLCVDCTVFCTSDNLFVSYEGSTLDRPILVEPAGPLVNGSNGPGFCTCGSGSPFKDCGAFHRGTGCGLGCCFRTLLWKKCVMLPVGHPRLLLPGFIA